MARFSVIAYNRTALTKKRFTDKQGQYLAQMAVTLDATGLIEQVPGVVGRFEC